MRRHWWINHEGNPVHLPCGAIGVDRNDTVHEHVADGRHWLCCRTCDTRLPIPPPRQPLWATHPNYQHPRSVAAAREEESCPS